MRLRYSKHSYSTSFNTSSQGHFAGIILAMRSSSSRPDPIGASPQFTLNALAVNGSCESATRPNQKHFNGNPEELERRCIRLRNPDQRLHPLVGRGPNTALPIPAQAKMERSIPRDEEPAWHPRLLDELFSWVRLEQ